MPLGRRRNEHLEHAAGVSLAERVGPIAAHLHGNQLVPDRLVPSAGAETGVAADHGEPAAAAGDQIDGPIELLLGEGARG